MKKTKVIDVNSRGTIAAGVILGTIGVLSFIVQPGLVQGFVSVLGLSEADANLLASIEMAGIAIATIIAIFLTPNVSWRIILGAAIIIAAVGNLFSAIGDNDTSLQLARFITGIGEGLIISLSFTIIGLTKKTERNIALYLALLMTYGAFGLWGMPLAFETIGLNGIFIIWAILTLIALITLKYVPVSTESQEEPRPSAVQLSIGWLILALLAVFAYNAAIGLAWANLFLIGMDIKPNEQTVANALLIAQFAGIIGAIGAVYLSDRIGSWWPLSLGVIIAAICISLLLGDTSILIFVIAVSGFNGLWNFTLPYLLSIVGDMDTKSRMMTLAIAIQMVGLGSGPYLASKLFESGFGFTEMEIITAVALVGSVIILSIPMRIHRIKLKNR
ncbi:MFS transporter [Polaribacter sp. L3A8]|uniref:MFS transporter n=1 Tax=Polaribacter sp. L3A8 TaxID=2686361 RepID=UPI00131B59D9|nr:MFS transporter [Polaribacter sp. L3A8]